MEKGLSKNAKKQLVNILFLLLLVGITLFILFTSNRELNFENVKNFILGCNPWLIAAAFACMLLFIGFEGLSLHLISRRLGHKCRLYSSMVYSAADVYYSALTPSASGGQPASAYYMVKDGMDTGTATFALVFNLIAYTGAILVIGTAGFLLRPHMFSQFGVWVKVLVAAGFTVQTLLLVFFIACMRCHGAVLKFGNAVISFLAKIRLMKNPDKWREKLGDEVEKYRAGFEEMKKHKALFFGALLLNIAQRVSQILINCFVCIAADGGIAFSEVFVMQAFVLIGYNSVPLPGGVGAFEYLYLRIYGIVFDDAFILAAMMVTRVISYYLCIVVSGLMTLAYHIHILKRNEGKKIQETVEDEKSE